MIVCDWSEFRWPRALVDRPVGFNFFFQTIPNNLHKLEFQNQSAKIRSVTNALPRLVQLSKTNIWAGRWGVWWGGEWGRHSRKKQIQHTSSFCLVFFFFVTLLFLDWSTTAFNFVFIKKIRQCTRQIWMFAPTTDLLLFYSQNGLLWSAMLGVRTEKMKSDESSIEWICFGNLDTDL